MFNWMNQKLVVLTLTSAFAFSGTIAVQAETGTNAAEMAGGEAGPVAQLSMAQGLYRYGAATGDALSVLAAARIIQSITTKDVEREVETMDTEGADLTENGEGVDAPVGAEEMLTAALELAGGDPTIVGLIEDAVAEGSRGRVGGASRTLSRLRAGRTDIYRVQFRGDRLAEIGITGDGDADLDMLVTDENGNTICLDRSYSDQIYCSFTPAWTGTFIIAVKNMGRIRNSYYILTN